MIADKIYFQPLVGIIPPPKKKLSLFLIICSISLCLTGCANEGDIVDIGYKQSWIFDNILIEVIDGYFYDSHEKFTVDENTIGLTIYFSNNVEEVWE